METGSSSSPSSNSPESLNGLKFGQKIYFEDVGTGAPAKKGRVGVGVGGVVQSGQGQPPRCQVEGCNVDLSDAKAYYSRHKVCGMHSKSPMVIVAGLEQRFCQQCSRFHQLPEFDQGKRSCRRRLAGHNERRRKPPPGSLLSARYGTLSSSIIENNNRAGGFLMDFTTYPRLPPRVSSNQLPHPWQSNPENPPPDLLHGSANRTHYPGPIIPPGGCFADSNCALSLLSNQPSGSRTQPSSLGPSYLLNPDGANMIQQANTHSGTVNHFSSTSWGFKGNEGSNNQFPSSPWGFKGNEGSGGSHEMHPDLGLGQFSQPANNSQYSGELELSQQSGRQYMELEQSRSYDSSDQHMHWSL